MVYYRQEYSMEGTLLMIPLIGFAGWSGSGKTTLIERLIPVLKKRGKRIAVIKHCRHGIDLEETGKDSKRYKAAGAEECILCGPEGPTLQNAVKAIEEHRSADIILAEGFKHAPVPKFGVERIVAQKELTEPADRFIAVVTDRKKKDCPVPNFGWDEIDQIGEFIMHHEKDLIYNSKKRKPSLDEWLKEAKSAETAGECGMYLFHNGVVRISPKAKVRLGEQTDKTVQAVRFSYDAEKEAEAEKRALQMPGIFFIKVWLNEGTLSVGEDLMLVLVGGDIRPHVIDALQSLVGEIKNSCVIEQEIYEE